MKAHAIIERLKRCVCFQRLMEIVRLIRKLFYANCTGFVSMLVQVIVVGQLKEHTLSTSRHLTMIIYLDYSINTSIRETKKWFILPSIISDSKVFWMGKKWKIFHKMMTKFISHCSQSTVIVDVLVLNIVSTCERTRTQTAINMVAVEAV